MGNSIQEGVANGHQTVLPVYSWDYPENGQFPIAADWFTMQVNIPPKAKLMWVVSGSFCHLSV